MGEEARKESLSLAYSLDFGADGFDGLLEIRQGVADLARQLSARQAVPAPGTLRVAPRCVPPDDVPAERQERGVSDTMNIAKDITAHRAGQWIRIT